MSRQDGFIVSSVEVKFPSTVDLGQIQLALEDNLNEVALRVRDYAKSSNAFQDKTGTLRGSIKKNKVRGGYRVWAKAPHAHLVEYGHVKVLWGNRTGEYVSAKPFLRPARERAVIEFINSLGWVQGSARAGSVIG
jgi:hypothetical protein